MSALASLTQNYSDSEESNCSGDESILQTKSNKSEPIVATIPTETPTKEHCEEEPASLTIASMVDPSDPTPIENEQEVILLTDHHSKDNHDEFYTQDDEMFVPGNGQESDEASDDEVQNLRESLLRKSRERAIKLKEQERLANDSKSNSNCDSANGNDLESDQELNRELTVKEYENGDEHRFDGESPPMSPESFHRSLIGLPPDQVTIPGAPKNQQCSSSLIEKFAGFHKKMQEGMDMIASIQKNKAFRNPSIYEKLIQFCDIDEFGSNFPIEVYDPHCWKETDYYDYLNKRQQEEMERRAREPKEPRTKVEFISGTAKKASAVSSTSGTVINHTTHSSVPVTLSSSVDKPVRKKSKWDVAGTTGTTTTSGNVGILIRPEIIRPSSEKALQSSTGAMTTTRGNVGILINPEIIRHKSEKPPTTFQLSHR